MAAEQSNSHAPPNVLLVDDLRANLLAMEVILGNQGYHLVLAASGAEALRLLLRQDFAVILMDVQMTEMDGFETARLIRGRQRSQHVPIIFLTAHEENRLSLEEAYGLGAVDYLVKPLSPVILRSKVAVFVELFEKTEQIKRQAEQLRQESEGRLRLAVEAADLGTWDHNLTTGERKWSDRCKRLFGLPPDAAVDDSVFLAGLHPEDRERTQQAALRALDPGGDGEYRCEYRTVGLQDGIERWIAARGRATFDEQGKPIRFLGTVLDVTERKRTEVERESLIRQLREALATVKTLRGLLPICAWCKQIRNNSGYWRRLEAHLQEHLDVTFTHGICPDCAADIKPRPKIEQQRV